MMRRRFSSGAALPESALVLSAILLLMIGSFHLVLVGYDQIATDAAAFTSARFTGVGDPNGSAKTSTAVSVVNPSDITTAQGLPAPASAPVNYNVSQDTNRHGGVTMIQAAQVATTVLKTNLDGLLVGADSLSVTSTSIAPQYLDFYAHEDVLGQTLNSSAALGNAQNYFTGGENVPPYFVGFHFFEYCETPLEGGPWNSCPSSIDFDAVGMAEFLDQDNWARTQPGVQGSDAVFKEMLCHQNAFANVAAIAYGAADHKAAAAVLGSSQPDVKQIYSWDVHAQGGYPPASYTGPGSFPTNPSAGCST
jgi:hypothetical protein